MREKEGVREEGADITHDVQVISCGIHLACRPHPPQIIEGNWRAIGIVAGGQLRDDTGWGGGGITMVLVQGGGASDGPGTRRRSY